MQVYESFSLFDFLLRLNLILVFESELSFLFGRKGKIHTYSKNESLKGALRPFSFHELNNAF